MTDAQLELFKRVVARHGYDLAPLYYVDSDDGEPDLGANFCFDHAAIVARWSARETGRETWIARCWGVTDDAYAHCEFGGCGQLLRTDGGITSDGVDSALALTEEDPFKASVSPEELSLAASAMANDDERWATWERQARRLLRIKPWRKS
jgi:hypothetical protein